MNTSPAMHIGRPRVALGQVDADDPDAFHHCFAGVNGIRVHYIDEGQGPLVILLHGFPYLWYMWRRQIDYYVDEFTRTGFTGALNYYRCRDRNWEITAFLDGALVRQPRPVHRWRRRPFPRTGRNPPSLRPARHLSTRICGRRYCYLAWAIARRKNAPIKSTNCSWNSSSR